MISGYKLKLFFLSKGESIKIPKTEAMKILKLSVWPQGECGVGKWMFKKFSAVYKSDYLEIGVPH